MFSREIAPLAGFYPAVYAGAPWWFLDAPEAIRRYRGAVTETAGFGRTSGFIDDTRAFCSIPARHDLARRVDARGQLATLITAIDAGVDAVDAAVAAGRDVGVLQQVDDPVRRLFEVNRLAVGQQMHVGFARERVRQAARRDRPTT